MKLWCAETVFSRVGKKWLHWGFLLAGALFVTGSGIRPSIEMETAEPFQTAHAVWYPGAAETLFRCEPDLVWFPDLRQLELSPSGGLEDVPFARIIQDAASFNQLDPDLIVAVIMAESRFNPRAVSRAGAKGLMQIMPVTAEALDIKDVYSPEENIMGGARHIKWLLSRVDGDLRLALAAYNAGLSKVVAYKGMPPYPETREYVAKVMRTYRAIKAGANMDS